MGLQIANHQVVWSIGRSVDRSIGQDCYGPLLAHGSRFSELQRSEVCFSDS